MINILKSLISSVCPDFRWILHLITLILLFMAGGAVHGHRLSNDWFSGSPLFPLHEMSIPWKGTFTAKHTGVPKCRWSLNWKHYLSWHMFGSAAEEGFRLLWAFLGHGPPWESDKSYGACSQKDADTCVQYRIFHTISGGVWTSLLPPLWCPGILD